MFIECKRISKPESFDTNFRKGSKQLTTRYEKCGLPRNVLGLRPLGILLFNATKAVNPHQSFLKVSTPMEADSILNDSIFRIMTNNAERIRSKIHSNTVLWGSNTHIPLILSRDFGSYIRWKFFPYHDSTHKFSKVRTAIISKLEGRMRSTVS